jgi:hypothetical protein
MMRPREEKRRKRPVREKVRRRKEGDGVGAAELVERERNAVRARGV